MKRRCLLTVVWLFPIVFAAGLARSDDDWDTHILKQLDEPTRIVFRDTPLHDAAVYLSDVHNIVIRLDIPAIEGIGMSVDTPVNARREKVPLHKALHDTLEPHNLSFMIKDGVLMVTTTQVAKEWQKEYAERDK